MMLENLSTNVLSSQLRTAISEGMNDYFQNEAKVINEIAYSPQKITKEQVQEAVDGLNQFLQPANTSVRFEYHEQLNEYYVKVVDDKTEEIIREIPSKKLLDFYAAMTEFVGLMVDKKI